MFLFNSNNFVITSEFTTTNLVSVEQNLINLTQIEILGLNLYTDYALLLLLSTIILLLALAAPILLTLKNKKSFDSTHNN